MTFGSLKHGARSFGVCEGHFSCHIGKPPTQLSFQCEGEVLVWQQKMADPFRLPFFILVIMTACVIVYLVFYFGIRISEFLGLGGTRVVTRLMGLLLAVIAVQFMVNGFQQIQMK